MALLFWLIVAMHMVIVIRLLFHFDYWEVLSVRHVLILEPEGALKSPQRS